MVDIGNSEMVGPWNDIDGSRVPHALDLILLAPSLNLMSSRKC